MASRYQMRIVHLPDGMTVVAWPPGLDDEHDLIESLCERVRAKGVGIGRSEAHVIEDVRAAFTELLTNCKRMV